MKKWPFIVAVLYGLIALALFFPLVWAAFGVHLKWKDAADMMLAWETWIIVGLMVVAQFTLLRVPVYAGLGRPVTQRPLLLTVIAAALMMGLLVIGAGISLFAAFLSEKHFGYFWIVAVIALGTWLFWSVYFYRTLNRQEPRRGVALLQRRLWSGSILELLVAVPTHVVVRHRGACCAGLLTFVGLCCGSSVMLFAFGPALYFCFADRWRRLQPAALPSA